MFPLEEVAHHEAGHAVAAVYFYKPFIHVTIVPYGDSAGHVKYAKMPRSIKNAAIVGDHENPRYIQWVEYDLITTLAGGIAHAKFNPKSDWREGIGDHGEDVLCSPGSDIQNVIHRVDDLHGKGPVADAYYAYVRARAVAFVERRWPEIQLVAAALLERKTLSSDEVRAVVFPEFRRDG
jgi:hypothetical protein